MAMEIQEVLANKKQFMELLFLADEQENMIDRYLERGRMFVLADDGIKAACVVTDEGGGVCELKSLAVYPQWQRRGYGRALVEYACGVFGKTHNTMLVGTGAGTETERFYQKCGFVFSHTVKNFFVDNYDHPMFEDGVQLKDMAYFKRELGGHTEDEE